MKVKRIIEIEEDTLKFVQELTEIIIPARSGKTLQKNVIEAIKFSKPYEEPRDSFDLGYVKGLEDGRPQGEWVFDGCDDVTCKCMFCGHEHVYVTSPEADGINFCEHCGAKMKGTKEATRGKSKANN